MNLNVVIPFILITLLYLLLLVWIQQTNRKESSFVVRREVEETLFPQLQMLQNSIKSLRKVVSRVVCTSGDVVTATGGWCLKEESGNPQLPGTNIPLARHHSLADSGLSPLLGDLFDHSSVLELGAGLGQYISDWRAWKKNITWKGYDGALNVEEYTKDLVEWADLSQPLNLGKVSYNWIFSLEVGEHIPQAYETVFIDNLDKYGECGLIISWGVPGQLGHSHVNLKTNEEIIELLSRRGYTYAPNFSKKARERAAYPWFKNSFMLFIRNQFPTQSCPGLSKISK